MKLEVCVDSLESVLNAVHGGADELEVCSSLAEGGLTPTAGLVQQVMCLVGKVGTGLFLSKTCPETCSCQKLTQRPKVNVMIRCRTGSDFRYSEPEMDTMIADIEIFKGMKVDRFVFGSLDEDKRVDEESCSRVIAKASPTPVTFHRAFDVTKDPLAAAATIIKLGFNRILTSGQKSSADDSEALKLIEALQAAVGDSIEIMPGAGVNAANCTMFTGLGCGIFHSSCKTVRVLPKIENSLSMGTADSECVFVTNVEIVKKIKEALSQ